MQELLYTSAPRGLKPGSRGFCTVLSTQGMVAPLAAALEGLSAYRPVYPTGHPQVAQNPVVYSHVKLQVAGKSWHVLSRIADYGLDYSQRTNKIAHHLVLDRSELPGAGPASVLRLPDLMRTAWEGEPQLVPPRTLSRQPAAPAGVCKTWKALTGDAGWAGVVAESFLKDSTRPVILLFEPGQDVAALFDEALSLLPPDKRWEVTFSSYFTGASQGVTCLWRGIAKGSREATESLRFVNALRIDLGTTDLGRAEGGELVDEARSGTRKLQLPPAPQAPPRATRPAPDATGSPENREPDPKPYALQPPDPAGPPPVSSESPGTAPPALGSSAFRVAQQDLTRLNDQPQRSGSWKKWIAVSLLLLCLAALATWLWIDRQENATRTKPVVAKAESPLPAKDSFNTETRDTDTRTLPQLNHRSQSSGGPDINANQSEKDGDKGTKNENDTAQGSMPDPQPKLSKHDPQLTNAVIPAIPAADPPSGEPIETTLSVIDNDGNINTGELSWAIPATHHSNENCHIHFYAPQFSRVSFSARQQDHSTIIIKDKPAPDEEMNVASIAIEPDSRKVTLKWTSSFIEHRQTSWQKQVANRLQYCVMDITSRNSRIGRIRFARHVSVSAPPRKEQGGGWQLLHKSSSKPQYELVASAINVNINEQVLLLNPARRPPAKATIQLNGEAWDFFESDAQQGSLDLRCKKAEEMLGFEKASISIRFLHSSSIDADMIVNLRDFKDLRSEARKNVNRSLKSMFQTQLLQPWNELNYGKPKPGHPSLADPDSIIIEAKKYLKDGKKSDSEIVDAMKEVTRVIEELKSLVRLETDAPMKRTEFMQKSTISNLVITYVAYRIDDSDKSVELPLLEVR